MGDVLKLIIPFYSVPKNYDEILRRLASLAFYEIYIITLILRVNPHFDAFITALESWGPVGKIVDLIPHHDVLDPAGFVIAVAIASLSYIFQLHDQISNVLGIRRRFDRNRILVPLANRVGVSMTNEKKAKIADCRDRLMRAVFYKYASSRSDSPLVDKHDIEQALSAWSWFWAFIEAVFYFAVGAAIAWRLGSSNLAAVFAGISTVSLVITWAQYLRLGRYARPQIDSISADEAAAAYVKQQFDAL
jgi:hypothetical protein